jgi:hypothetical protein
VTRRYEAAIMRGIAKASGWRGNPVLTSLTPLPDVLVVAPPVDVVTPLPVAVPFDAVVGPMLLDVVEVAAQLENASVIVPMLGAWDLSPG